MNNFQISLAAARVNAKMKQIDAAKALNVTKQTIIRWEKGRSEPTYSQVCALSEIYQVPIEHLRV